MIHTCRQSPKFKLFVRKLRPMAQNPIVDVESVAVSTLERLWHQTAIGAKQGDIGKFDDELIAEECGWLGDASTLISLLVDCGYLDRCLDHRLIVHDWSQHAPKHVKASVKIMGGFFETRCDHIGTTSGVDPLGGTLEDAPLTPHPPNQTNPNQTNPNQTNPNQTKPNQTKGVSQQADPDEAEVLKAWNETLGKSARLTAKRAKAIKVRLGEQWWRENWREALGKVRGSPFLMGDNDTGWTANIDFFLKPDTVTKILEGKYDGKPSGNRGSRGQSSTGREFAAETF